MAHQVETMAYANELPWHGLGVKVNPNVSTDDMLKKAGLDWEVQPQPMYIKKGKEFVEVKERVAMVRSSDQEVLTIASPDWVPVQNRDTLDFFKRYCKAGATLETAGSLRTGKIIWALANLKHDFKVGRSDVMKSYLLFRSSHQVGAKTRVFLTDVRVVCNNTMAAAMAGEKDNQYSQSHLSEFDFEAAHSVIGLCHEMIEGRRKDYNTIKSLKMSGDDTIRFLFPLFNKGEEATKLSLASNDNWSKTMSEVMASYEKAPGAEPGTGWGVFNAVTHWSDHVAGRSVNARLQRAWFGDRAKLKAAALDGLLKLAA